MFDVYMDDPFVRESVEISLDKKGLSIDEIATKNFNELKQSLCDINYAARNPDDIEMILINNNKVDITPIILERKRTILKRMQELSTDIKIGNIKEIIFNMPEGDAKRNITEELNSFQEESLGYKKELQDIAARETEAKIKLEQQRIDGLERKSKIWLSFLQRESAASIIGGIVLLMVTVALIGGMIFGAESQILSNGFLVILGYFFGQSSSKNKDGM